MAWKRIHLRSGTVIVPEDFIVLEKTATKAADYAGVVAEKNGTLPHFLVLSEKPICELTAEEERIYTLCGELVPAVNKVREQEVAARYDDNGFLTNAAVWARAPRLGIFAIPETDSEEKLHLNTGIIRKGM